MDWSADWDLSYLVTVQLVLFIMRIAARQPSIAVMAASVLPARFSVIVDEWRRERRQTDLKRRPVLFFSAALTMRTPVCNASEREKAPLTMIRQRGFSYDSVTLHQHYATAREIPAASAKAAALSVASHVNSGSSRPK